MKRVRVAVKGARMAVLKGWMRERGCGSPGCGAARSVARVMVRCSEVCAWMGGWREVVCGRVSYGLRAVCVWCYMIAAVCCMSQAVQWRGCTGWLSWILGRWLL